MPADPLYEALHPFHQWAQIAAVCAFVLATASFTLLASSPRRSRRWWLGMAIFGLCLLAVVFGARSRGASYDLRPIAAVCLPPPGVSGCELWSTWLVAARQRAAILGVVLLVGTITGLALTGATLLLPRHSAAPVRRPSARIPVLATAIAVAGWGMFQTANSVARWIETAYLADITRAGDGLGQLPLIEAIFGTIFGAIVLVIGLALVIFFSKPQRTTARRAAVMHDQAYHT
jgi:hypothetical protein